MSAVHFPLSRLINKQAGRWKAILDGYATLFRQTSAHRLQAWAHAWQWSY
jgi:hypothetical protein